MMGGLKFVVVPNWLSPVYLRHEFQRRVTKIPPKSKRKISRRRSKRLAGPRGWLWRPIFEYPQPAEVMRSGDTVFCTAQQYAAIKAGVRAAALVEGS